MVIEDKENYDICIIGAGPAGITLANQLSKDFKIAVLEKGPEKNDQPISDYKIETRNLPLRSNSRNIGLGGTTNSWASLSSLYEPDSESEGTEFLWGIPYPELIENYKQASSLFSFPDYEIYRKDVNYHNLEKSGLRAKIFAGTHSRINFKDFVYKNSINNSVEFFFNSKALRLVQEDKKISCCEYIDNFGNKKTLISKIFICSSGGVENALILKRSFIGKDLPVGRYFMDHYKFRSGMFEITDYKKFNDFFGGIKNGSPFYHGITNLNNKLLNPYIRLEPVYPWSKGTAIKSFISLIGPLKYFFLKISNLFKINSNVISSSEYYEDRDISDSQLSIFGKIFDVILNIKIIVLYIIKRIFPIFPIYPSRGVIFNHLDMESRYENIIDTSTKDKSINHEFNASADLTFKNEFNSVKDLHIKFANFIKDEGMGVYHFNELELKKMIENNIQDASHHMGSTRIGDSADSSVVDINLKVHNIDNLFITGSSVFRHGQNSNPTYTIVALSLRLSKHLKERKNALK